jgi:hypothetical protein
MGIANALNNFAPIYICTSGLPRPSHLHFKLSHLPFLIWSRVVFAVPALRHGVRSVPIPASRPTWMRDLRLYLAREA